MHRNVLNPPRHARLIGNKRQASTSKPHKTSMHYQILILVYHIIATLSQKYEYIEKTSCLLILNLLRVVPNE